MLNIIKKVQGIGVETDNKELICLQELNSHGFKMGTILVAAYFLLVIAIMQTSFFEQYAFSILISLTALIIFTFFLLWVKSQTL